MKIADSLFYDEEAVLQFLSLEPRGEVPVFFYYMADHRGMLLNERYWVNDDPALWSRLRDSFGAENINVKIVQQG